MELTRRDVIAALAAGGVAVGGGAAILSTRDSDPDTDHPLDSGALSTLVAAAEVLYPSDVENVDGFVREYTRGKATDREGYVSEFSEAAAYLDEYASAWYDEEFTALSLDERDEALTDMNADTVDPNPDGSGVEHVRYYVVNELLFALYTTPTGGELVGIENPQGHPGGLASYQRGPQA